MNTADLDQGPPADTVGGLVTSISARLRYGPEATWIVARAANVPAANLPSLLDGPVSRATVEAVRVMVERRAAGEPLQYILGSWAFRHLEVDVDARALVPRPETEQVVEVALEELRLLSDLAGRHPSDPLVAVDLGTGSGVIALSLALEGAGPGVARPAIHGRTRALAPPMEVWATDASRSALELAQANLSRLGGSHPAAAARVRLADGSWFDALPRLLAGRVHLVVSNPPYVSEAEWSALDPEIRDHEPRVALVAGATGLEALEHLVDRARRWLVPGAASCSSSPRTRRPPRRRRPRAPDISTSASGPI